MRLFCIIIITLKLFKQKNFMYICCMENQIIKILNKYGYSYDNGIVIPPRNENDLDSFALNYELDEVVLEDEDFRFSYEIRNYNGVLKLFKNEL